jgi:hypothetical protein
MSEAALKGRLCRRIGVAYPRFFGEPLVLGPAKRAVNAREEHRRGIKARPVCNDAGRNIATRVGTFDHDGTHEDLPI